MEKEMVKAGDIVANVVESTSARLKQITFALALGSYLAMFGIVASYALAGAWFEAIVGAILAVANGVMVYKIATKLKAAQEDIAVAGLEKVEAK